MCVEGPAVLNLTVTYHHPELGIKLVQVDWRSSWMYVYCESGLLYPHIKPSYVALLPLPSYQFQAIGRYMPNPFYTSLLLLPFSVFTYLRSLWSTLRVVLTRITNKSRRHPSESESSLLRIYVVTRYSNKIFIRADSKKQSPKSVANS